MCFCFLVRLFIAIPFGSRRTPARPLVFAPLSSSPARLWRRRTAGEWGRGVCQIEIDVAEASALTLPRQRIGRRAPCARHLSPVSRAIVSGRGADRLG